MKDYSRNEAERKEFILSYKEDKKNGKIILYLANGESYPIPYTEENLKKVDSRQKVQVKNADINAQEHAFSRFKKAMFKVRFVLTVTAGILFGIFAPNPFTALLACVGYSICSVVIFTGIEAIALRNSKKIDLEKSKFFLENEEKINANLNKQNALLNVSLKTVAKIEEVKAANRPFNINDIDKLPLRDLKQLKANIDRIMSFGFDEGATKEKGHQKVYGTKELYK